MSPRFSPSIFARAAGAGMAAVLLFGGTASAFAGTPGATSRSVEVPYGDLDLTDEAGVETLQSRVRGAARAVCASAPRSSLRDNIDYQNCFAEAMQSGSRAVVTLVARAESGETLAAGPSASIAIGN